MTRGREQVKSSVPLTGSWRATDAPRRRPPVVLSEGVFSPMLHFIRGRVAQSLIGALGVSMALGACSPQKSQANATSSSPAESPAAPASQSTRGASGAAFFALPIPPGVDPASLTPRGADDANARLSLDEALANLTPVDVLPPPRSSPEPTEDVLRETMHLYLEAREMAGDGRYFDSIRALEQALKLDPGAVACMRLMADNYLSTTGPARALKLYEDILALDSDDAEALLRLGSAAWQRRDVPQAAGLLGKVYLQLSSVSVAAGDRDIWSLAAHELGQVLLRHGYDEAGVSVWHRLLQRLPNSPPESARFQREIDRLYRVAPEMWRDLGDAYCRLERYDDAVDVYAQAFGAARLNHEDMLPRLIWSLSKAGRTQDAIDVLLEAIDAPEQTGTIELVSLFRDTPLSDPLAAALRQRLGEHPGELRYVQAIAGLLPADRSDAIILDFLTEHGAESTVLRDLLPWAVQRLAPVQPVRLIVAAAQKSGQVPDDLLDDLVALTDDPQRFVGAWNELPETMKKEPAAQLVRIGLLLRDFQYDEVRKALDALLAAHPESTAALLGKASLLLVLNLTDEAWDLVQSVKGHADDPVELTYRRALLLAQVGEIERAIDLLDRLAIDRPQAIDPVDHLRRKARLLVSAGRLTEAAAVLNEALAKDPRDSKTYGALVRLYGLGSPLQDATQFGDLVRALFAAAPDSRAFRMLRAEQDASRGRFDDAIAGYQSLLAEDITDHAALTALAKVWFAAGRASEAGPWFAARRVERPGDRGLRNVWIASLVADQRAGDAIEALRRAIEAHPYDLDSYVRLEESLRSVGREEEARQVARDRWMQQPLSVARSLALAQLDIQADQGESALKNLRQALELSSNHFDRNLDGITALASRIDAEDLRTQALELIEAIGRDVIARQIEAAPSVLIAYVQAVAELDRPLEMIVDAIEQARLLQPTIAYEMTAIATMSLTHQDRLDDACALSDRWLGVDRPLEDREAGLIEWRLERGGERDEVDRVLNLALRAHETELYRSLPILNARRVAGQPKGNPLAESLYQLSAEFSTLGHDASHERLLEEVLKIDPDHPLANNDLGYSLADRNERLDDAEAMLVKATQAKPSDSAVLDSLGWVRYKLGKLENPDNQPREAYEDAAIPLLEEAALLRKSERRPEIATTVILDHLGDAYWRAGRKEEAESTWQKSVENYDQFLQTVQRTLNAAEAAAQIELYKKVFGDIVEGARAKVDAVKSGKEPSVAACPALDKNQP